MINRRAQAGARHQPVGRSARGGGRRRAARRSRRPGRLVATGLLALAIGGAIAWTQLAASSSKPDPPAMTDRVLGAGDAERVTTDVRGGGKATLVRSASLGRAVLLTKKLPELPRKKTYQMWLLTAKGNLVSAGLMEPAVNKPTLLDGEAGNAAAAAVSIEPTGGSKQPTSDLIVLFDFKALEAK
ncbi:MAG: anti-sigma factor [Nocardioides sp.]